MEKTELYILSGFLGSGKTTLLKRLLEDEKTLHRKTAVIMNELGNVSIDSNAVEEDVTLKELLGGCICCSMQGQLEVQLQDLLFDEHPEVIYIETTGAAHPVEVLDSVLSPLLVNQITVKGIITTVDGLRWLNRKSLSSQLQSLLLEQVIHANYLLINKTDVLSEDEQAKITYEIQSLNSSAPCMLTTYSKVSIEKLRNLSFMNSKMEHVSLNKHIHLTAFVHCFHSSVNRASFEDFIHHLPETIYRIKGYIKFDHSNYPFMFQFSYGMPIYIKEYVSFPLNMVFIGEQVDWEFISQQLKLLEE